jgi:excisionase family DNA binding protein
VGHAKLTLPGKLRQFVPQTIQSATLKGHKGDLIVAQIMTTKELAVYLRLHQITICKLSKEGKIPSIRIGRVWRFDKELIDDWIARKWP